MKVNLSRLSKAASRMRRKRENETEEARAARLAKCRTIYATRVRNETEDARCLRLSKVREYAKFRRRRLHRLEARKQLENLEPPIAVFIKQEFGEEAESCSAESSNNTLSSSSELMISANDPDPLCCFSEVVVEREEDPEGTSSSELIIPEKEDSELSCVQPVREEVLTECNRLRAVVPEEEPYDAEEEEEIKPPVSIFIKQEVTEEEEENPFAETNNYVASVSSSRVITEDDPDCCISADQMETEKQTERINGTGNSEYINPDHLTLTFSHKRFSSEDTTEKLYECTVCKMRFSLKLLCDIHKQLHAGQKLNECHVYKSTIT